MQDWRHFRTGARATLVVCAITGLLAVSGCRTEDGTILLSERPAPNFGMDRMGERMADPIGRRAQRRENAERQAIARTFPRAPREETPITRIAPPPRAARMPVVVRAPARPNSTGRQISCAESQKVGERIRVNCQ